MDKNKTDEVIKVNPLYSLDYTDLNNISYYNLKSKWILFLQDLTNSQININASNILTNIKVLKDWDSSVSNSESKIIYGDIKHNLIPKSFTNNKILLVNHKIIIKITKSSIDYCDNSLKIELMLYRYVLNNLLYKNYTPHIIGYINDRKLEINNELYDYLFLEMSDGKPLKSYILDNNFSINDFIGITFQILYTLSVFNNILLSHNDLHPGNFIIENKDINYSYKINDKIYILKCKYLVKIFDFDNSSIYNENMRRNIKLDYYKFCENSNTCNVYTNNDLYMSLWVLYKLIEYKNYKNQILEIFDYFVDDGIYKQNNFRLNYNNVEILNNYKSPIECLKILCDSKYSKECINIKSNLQEEKYQYELPDIKYFNSYYPKLENIYSSMDSSINNKCNNTIYKINILNTFKLDIKFLVNNYKYNIYTKTKELLVYCESNNIPMNHKLAMKLVIPFIYGIPNYINHILTNEEKPLYKYFANNVKYILPITIINIYGNSGITEFY